MWRREDKVHLFSLPFFPFFSENFQASLPLRWSWGIQGNHRCPWTWTLGCPGLPSGSPAEVKNPQARTVLNRVSAVSLQTVGLGKVAEFKKDITWGTWGTQWLSICLRLRMWSWSSGIESHIGLLHGACFFSLCLCLCLSLSPSWINK